MISPATPVTLNWFQGLFLRSRRSIAIEHGAAAGSLRQPAALAARWMLKQVQHDDLVEKAA
jgi:hypothetical protein